MPGEALILIVCKNDKTRVFFRQIFFVIYKEIYKTHSVMISKLRKSYFMKGRKLNKAPALIQIIKACKYF